jgi:hypothetical protein
MDRRGFLRSTAGGSMAIALASWLPAGCAADHPHAARDGVKLRALTPKQYATARAAAEALLVGVPAGAAAVAARMDQELALIGDPVRSDMKTVLSLLENLTIFAGFTAPFSELSKESRLVCMNDWRDSRFALRRGSFQATKSFIYFYAYAEDGTRTVTGFNGPWREHTHVAAYPVDFGTIT